jgi:hypothetical protein
MSSGSSAHCPTCGTEISVKSKMCPHCGRVFDAIEPWLASGYAYWEENHGRQDSEEKTARSVFSFGLKLLVLCGLAASMVAYACAAFFNNLIEVPGTGD